MARHRFEVIIDTEVAAGHVEDAIEHLLQILEWPDGYCAEPERVEVRHISTEKED